MGKDCRSPTPALQGGDGLTSDISVSFTPRELKIALAALDMQLRYSCEDTADVASRAYLKVEQALFERILESAPNRGGNHE